jgi:hypothetical protein
VIAIDTNILVYAHRVESRYHQQAYEFLRSLVEGERNWSIPWSCLYEFFSVVTNPRIWKDTATVPSTAKMQIETWCGSPSVKLLGETPDIEPVVYDLLALPRVRGPIVHDARIAALCLAHGVDELITKDRDFHLFPMLKTRDPFTT